MTIDAFMHTGLFNWLIMPLLIFCSRILDMSLGTVRVVMISKGYRKWAPIIGFFEVLIWLVAVRQVITSMDNILWMLSYAGGFAAGTYIGMAISDRLNMGHVLFHIITKKDCTALLGKLRQKKLRYAHSYDDDDKQQSSIIYTVVPAKDVQELGEFIVKDYPRAFYAVQDVRKVSQGVTRRHPLTHNWLQPLRRQGK